jgi:hypothetical protein
VAEEVLGEQAKKKNQEIALLNNIVKEKMLYNIEE